jgi:hypothetical protein
LSTRLPDAVPGFTSPPVVDGESWLYQFHEEGVYDLLCLPHVVFGMVMRIVVMETEADDDNGGDAGDGAEDDDGDDAGDGAEDDDGDDAGDGAEDDDGDDAEADMEDDASTPAPTEGLPPNIKHVFDAPELAPENIVEEGSVAWADLTLTEE